MSRTGVHERPIAGPDDRLTEYVVRAAAQALERAGSELADVDLVIVGTLTQDEIQPNAAPQVAYEMGARMLPRSTSAPPARHFSRVCPSPPPRSRAAGRTTSSWSALIL